MQIFITPRPEGVGEDADAVEDESQTQEDEKVLTFLQAYKRAHRAFLEHLVLGRDESTVSGCQDALTIRSYTVV